LRGEKFRKSLDLRNWEAANKLVRDREIDGPAVVRTARAAVESFLSDREAMKLSEAMMRKYRHVGAEIKALFGDRPVGSIAPDEIREMRKNWKLAAITAQKRMEMVRKFFSFCVDAEWEEKSPAWLVKIAPAKYAPTLPFSYGDGAGIVAGGFHPRGSSKNPGRDTEEIESSHPAYALFGYPYIGRGNVPQGKSE
jgi:anti-sigma factor RsiW